MIRNFHWCWVDSFDKALRNYQSIVREYPFNSNIITEKFVLSKGSINVFLNRVVA